MGLKGKSAVSGNTVVVETETKRSARARHGMDHVTRKIKRPASSDQRAEAEEGRDVIYICRKIMHVSNLPETHSKNDKHQVKI